MNALTRAFSGWFLYVTWLVIEPATLVYQDNALSNWAMWPRPNYAKVFVTECYYFCYFFPMALFINYLFMHSEEYNHCSSSSSNFLSHSLCRIHIHGRWAQLINVMFMRLFPTSGLHTVLWPQSVLQIPGEIRRKYYVHELVHISYQ